MTRDLVTDEPIEDERYELRAGPCYEFTQNRREFVEVLGAGILIAVAASRAEGQQPGSPRAGGTNPNAGSEKLPTACTSASTAPSPC